jgi:PhzF family phenazine biosynthesis protein
LQNKKINELDAQSFYSLFFLCNFAFSEKEMELKYYILDAFTDSLFGGNPAAVCPLEKWLPDEIMQQIAMENNLAETAFFVKEENAYHIKWFTPMVEVDLCGHATLASAYVLFFIHQISENQIEFNSRSGRLVVSRNEMQLTLDFPSDQITETEVTDEFRDCFNILPQKIFKGKTDYMFVFKSQADIINLQPNYPMIARLAARGVIVTAKGEESDFVSRFFAPQAGIFEDPVTGSAHTTLTPYWRAVLLKDELTAMQLSKRKGILKCKYINDRVEISGEVVLFASGTIYLDEKNLNN